jgi:squalene-associated FAD-dependent desaturase
MTGPGTDVVVVGGGLAGLAAALECADRGARVVLVERRPRLGGLTWSFEHDGRTVDNGQHVFLRCCHAYLDFLRRLGSDSDVVLQRRLDVTVLSPGSGTARLRRNRLPAPLHLAPSLLRYPHLAAADRLRLGRAAWALRTADLDDPALDGQTFSAWLEERGQSQAAVQALWDLITVPTVNLPAGEASAAMGAKVFQTGLLSQRAAADIGWSQVPLGLLHGERAASALKRVGAEVSTGETVVSVEPGKGSPASPLTVHTDRRRLVAGVVVVAVPHLAVDKILPPGAFPAQESVGRLGTSPIVDVHVVYDRPVTELPFAAALGSPVQWFFDRTATSGMKTAPGGAQYLAVSVSAADAWVGRHPKEIASTVVAALEDLLPGVRRARVLDTMVTKERTATFRASPGTGALRPGPRTAVHGLVLAGAWTATGWPATMEGAVRSGQAAARVALEAPRRQAEIAGAVQPSMTVQPLPEEVA